MQHEIPQHLALAFGSKSLPLQLPAGYFDADLYPLYRNAMQSGATQDGVTVIFAQVLRNQLRVSKPQQPGPVARFSFLPLEQINMGKYTIGDNQYQDVGLTPLDAAGLPTTEPNALTFTSSDPSIVTVGNALDAGGAAIPLAVRCAAAQPPKLGAVTITVSDGKATGAFTVEVVAGAVASFGDAPLGTPQDLPAGNA